MPSGGEDAFTLPEMLVVILIIGILAAIALPAFLHEGGKGQDAAAKSLVRNVAERVEECRASQAPETCTNAVVDAGGLPLAAAPGARPAEGQASVTRATATAYTVTTLSASGVTYRYRRTNGRRASRRCSPAGQGACRPNGRW